MQPKVGLGNVLWAAPRGGGFRLGYVAISSDSDSFANGFSSSSYVDPPSFRSPDAHHPRSVTKQRSEKAFGRPSRPYTHFPNTW